MEEFEGVAGLEALPVGVCEVGALGGEGFGGAGELGFPCEEEGGDVGVGFGSHLDYEDAGRVCGLGCGNGGK